MSSQQLKDLFEAGLAAPAPDRVDVDAAIATGRRRRRIRVGATVLASAAAVVVAALLVAGVVPPRTTGPVSPADSAPLPIPTTPWKDGDAGMTALAEGVLMLRPDRCLVLVSEGADYVIAWPAGFTAVQVVGGVDVFGADGALVAREGERVALGGGEGRVGVTGPCLDTPTPVFAVNQAPPYDRSEPTATPVVWRPASSVNDLQGTWLAVRLGGDDAGGAVDLQGLPLRLAVRGSSLSARDGLCNQIEEGVQVEEGGSLVLSSPSMTAVGCDQNRAGWPAAGTAAYEAARAEVREAESGDPRRMRLLADDGSLLGEYVEVAAPGSDGGEAGFLCMQGLASGPGLVDVSHARLTTVGAVRALTGGPRGAAVLADAWPGTGPDEPAAWCTSRAGSTWSVTAVTQGGAPIMVITAGTPLGDPGPDGPPIP
jgi:hypothetical protein